MPMAKPTSPVGASVYSTNTGRVLYLLQRWRLPDRSYVCRRHHRGRATGNYFGLPRSPPVTSTETAKPTSPWVPAAILPTPAAPISSTTTAHTRPEPQVPTSSSRDRRASGKFGSSLAAGDFNADGTTDLAVGARSATTNTGRSYIFHQDGSYPTTAASADVTIIGETTNNYFGCAILAEIGMPMDGRILSSVRTETTSDRGKSISTKPGRTSPGRCSPSPVSVSLRTLRGLK
jgi:hypothetical protein